MKKKSNDSVRELKKIIGQRFLADFKPFRSHCEKCIFEHSRTISVYLN